MKWIASGNITHWANGAVIIWALMRRGANGRSRSSRCPASSSPRSGRHSSSSSSHPVVLFLKGKWLYGAVVFFCLFHLMTYIALGIHFLPTVICWAAFLPLEKLVPKRFAAR